jgi:hypothetical protein
MHEKHLEFNVKNSIFTGKVSLKVFFSVDPQKKGDNNEMSKMRVFIYC